MPAQQTNVVNYMNLGSALEMAPSGDIYVNGKHGQIHGTFETTLQNGNRNVRTPCRVASLDKEFENRTFCRVENGKAVRWEDFTNYFNQTSNQPRVTGNTRQQSSIPPQTTSRTTQRSRNPVNNPYGRETSRRTSDLYGDIEKRAKDYAKCKARGGTNCNLEGGVKSDANKARRDFTDWAIEKAVGAGFKKIKKGL